MGMNLLVETDANPGEQVDGGYGSALGWRRLPEARLQGDGVADSQIPTVRLPGVGFLLPLQEQPQPVYCEWCEMWLGSPTQAFDHRTGRKHRRNVKREQREGLSAAAAATGL